MKHAYRLRLGGRDCPGRRKDLSTGLMEDPLRENKAAEAAAGGERSCSSWNRAGGRGRGRGVSPGTLLLAAGC